MVGRTRTLFSVCERVSNVAQARRFFANRQIRGAVIVDAKPTKRCKGDVEIFFIKKIPTRKPIGGSRSRAREFRSLLG